jgi:hypothetical protein
MKNVVEHLNRTGFDGCQRLSGIVGKLLGLGSAQSDHRSIFSSCVFATFSFFLRRRAFQRKRDDCPRSFLITNQLQSRPTLIQSRQHGQRTRVSIHNRTVSNFRIGPQHTTLRKLLTHFAESTSTACRHLRTGCSTNCRAPTPPRPRPVPTSSETACL